MYICGSHPIAFVGACKLKSQIGVCGKVCRYCLAYGRPRRIFRSITGTRWCGVRGMVWAGRVPEQRRCTRTNTHKRLSVAITRSRTTHQNREVKAAVSLSDIFICSSAERHPTNELRRNPNGTISIRR